MRQRSERRFKSYLIPAHVVAAGDRHLERRLAVEVESGVVERGVGTGDHAPGTVPPGGGRIDGRIAEGPFTAANFIGPFAGMSVAQVWALIESGGAYVNVHTNDGVAPGGTGPGDLPGGEIRGDF